MRLHIITTDTRFDPTGHEEQWKNELAKELNSGLEAASRLDAFPNARERLFSYVARIAEFEEIRPL